MFVVDTDAYAGDFARQICAYMTGQLSEYGPGVKIAHQFQAEHRALYDRFRDKILHVSSEGEPGSPVTIWPTENRFQDEFGNCWDVDADEKEIKHCFEISVLNWYENAKEDEFNAAQLNNDESRMQHVNALHESMEAALRDGPRMLPVYESVGIFFCDQANLIEEECTFLRNRAVAFCANYWPAESGANIQIKQFRLIRFEIAPRIGVTRKWEITPAKKTRPKARPLVVR